jgi:hypothetical protein
MRSTLAQCLLKIHFLLKKIKKLGVQCNGLMLLRKLADSANTVLESQNNPKSVLIASKIIHTTEKTLQIVFVKN